SVGTRKACASYLLENLNDLLIGAPANLKAHSTHITKRWASLFKHKKKKSFYEKVCNAFDYSAFQRSKKKGKWFAQRLNIKSCPYCNAQFTLVAVTEKRDVYTKFQFDHFYPKEKYPFFAVS